MAALSPGRSLAAKRHGSGGIRTHASEETGALNQRLRPLGQPAMIQREILERVLAIAKDNAKTGYYELFVLLPELALINGNKTLFTIC